MRDGGKVANPQSAESAALKLHYFTRTTTLVLPTPHLFCVHTYTHPENKTQTLF